MILDRYHSVDVARKVVGVGSVGTRCAVALMAGEHDPVLLQIKEALVSVLDRTRVRALMPITASES